jgi:hypothetical protein
MGGFNQNTRFASPFDGPLRIVHLVIGIIAVLETLVQASYYLDDTDSSIPYVGYWVPVSRSSVDRTKLYNGTS